MKRQLAPLLLLVALSASAADITTIIVVRHADRASVLDADSPLSKAGFARARELARVLASANLTAVYATQYVRTQQTVAPVAADHHLRPIIINTTDTYAHDLVADILAHHNGETVLVASHSDRIPSLLQELGVPNPPKIALTEYDDIFVVTPPKLLVLRYGATAR